MIRIRRIINIIRPEGAIGAPKIARWKREEREHVRGKVACFCKQKLKKSLILIHIFVSKTTKYNQDNQLSDKLFYIHIAGNNRLYFYQIIAGTKICLEKDELLF